MGAQPSSSSGASAPASSAPAYEHPPTGATATTGGGGSNGRHANRLCEGGEGGGPQDLEAYAIRLTPEQSLQLYGLWSPKRTLTWRDVLEHSTIYLGSCVRYGISPTKLNRMQPDIKLWIQYGKATVADCEHMLPWRPDPFKDLGCSIGDLVVYRRVLPPTLLIESGTTFAMLRLTISSLYYYAIWSPLWCL